jgi:hypothetical protein
MSTKMRAEICLRLRKCRGTPSVEGAEDIQFAWPVGPGEAHPTVCHALQRSNNSQHRKTQRKACLPEDSWNHRVTLWSGLRNPVGGTTAEFPEWPDKVGPGHPEFTPD